jgi:hypothetical protein
VAAAWVVDGPWLLGLAVVAMAATSGSRAVRRALMGGIAMLALWGISHFILIGRPFASPSDFILADMGGSITTVALESEGATIDLMHALRAGGGQALALLLALLPVGLLGMWKKDRRLTLGLAIAALSLALPGVLATGENASHRSLLLLLVLVMPLGGLMSLATSVTPKGVLRLIGMGLIALFAIGAVRTYTASQEPFRIATERAVRKAKVTLGNGIPCDFLPWEHMSWECSHHDRGHFNQVGLALPDGVHVDGKVEQLMLIPTGSRRRQARTVAWEAIRATKRFLLRFAKPDRPPSGHVRLDVVVNDETVGSVDTRRWRERQVHEVVFDTSNYANQSVKLLLRVTPLYTTPNDAPGAAIAVDGGFGRAMMAPTP